MTKDFDTTLRGAIDLAAQSAHTAGASAARIRGRKRTMRKRIAVSTMSFVLIAAGATVAFKTVGHGAAPQIATANPTLSVSPSPSASAAASQSPSAAPSAGTSPSGGTSGSASASPGVSTSPPHTSNPSIAADPHQAASGAWLSPGQLPLAQTFAWKAERADPQGSSPIGQQLTPTVFYVANDTPFQTLTTCADPTKLLGRTSGAQHTEFTGANAASGDQASQFVFFFADAGSAQQSFAWLQSQYGPSCLSGSGVTVTKTAGDGSTDATWLISKGSAGNPDLPAYTREYFVLRGSTIAYVSVISNRSGLPTAYDDTAELSTIAAHLCVYGGPCH